MRHLLLLILTACGSTNVYQVLLRQPTAPTGRGVEVYVRGRDPARPADEVAIVEAHGFGTHANAETVVEAIAQRSAQLGCDAVVRVHVELGHTMAHASGICVRWPAPQP